MCSNSSQGPLKETTQHAILNNETYTRKRHKTNTNMNNKSTYEKDTKLMVYTNN
jgi:hypothetical protein